MSGILKEKMNCFFKNQMRRKRWHKVMLVLSSVVVFCTVYALILPAITLEKKTICGIEEHIHTEQCYSEEQGEQKLVCGLEEHKHTEICYETQEILEVPENQTTENVLAENADIPNADNIVEGQSSTSTDIIPGVQEAENILAQSGESEQSKSGSSNQDAKTEMQLVAAEQSTVQSYPLPSENIKGSVLHYKGKNDVEWKPITSGITLPGDATIRLEVKYKDIIIQTLLDHDGRMTYTLPSILRDPNAVGDIKVGETIVGTITAKGNTLTLSFNQNWLKEQLNSNQTTLNGSFFVESAINLEVVPDGGSSNIQIGDVNMEVHFDRDVIAQSANVTIEKSVSTQTIHTAAGTFLEYVLTVTAGQDGCPDVKVVDHFTIKDVIEKYVGVGPIKEILTDNIDPAVKPKEVIESGKSHGQVYQGSDPTVENPIPLEGSVNIVNPGALVWVIGDMQKNEVRTLTYRVKLKQNTQLNGKAINNAAVVFSKTYQRAEATSPFTPQATMGMNKAKMGEVRRDEKDGSYLIHYRVWFDAATTNNYTMTNVKVTDSLKHNSNSTQSEILPYVKYDQNSFKLYKGTKEPNINNIVNNTDYQVKWLEQGNKFELEIGDMSPGDTYCMEYDVRVGVEAFAVINASQLDVRNRVLTTSTNTAHLSGGVLQAYNTNVDMQYHHWVEKLVGDPITNDNRIVIAGEIYEQKSDGKIQKMQNPPSEFVVPKGSYLYTVTVNDLGDWDVTSASMKDTLGNEHMEFVGFVEVSAYDVKKNQLVESRWVKIDKLKSFNFTPKDIGFQANQYKYVFSYYAKPVNLGNVSQVIVGNEFNLSGTIGHGDFTYLLTGIFAKKDVMISGSRSFEAMKHPWYYEGAKNSVGKWSNGAIYWVIHVQGTAIQQGTYLKDFISPKNSSEHNLEVSHLHSDSIAGIYKGTLPDGKSMIDYSDLDVALSSGALIPLDKEAYDVQFSNSQGFSGNDNFSEVTIQIKHELTLAPDSMYVVIKSEPQNIPMENRSWKEYKNGLASSDNGQDWAERNVTSKHLYGGENILKELGRIVSWDGTRLTEITTGKGGEIITERLQEAGIYTSWAIKVNYSGNLSGNYRIIDTVPEGMEVAYARLKWRGEGYSNVVERPLLVQIPGLVSKGWVEHTITADRDSGGDNGDRSVTSYYYTKNNQVCWEVNNLIAGKIRDTTSVDCQIVCRLTDADVLQGGQTKTFENTVSLINPSGVEVDNDSNPVTIGTSTMSKSAAQGGSSIPFTITVNDLGQDLVQGTDEITLIDEMSSTLKLDTTSIQVKNTNTGIYLNKNEFKASLDTMPIGSKTQILRVLLPDKQPLEITYKATVQAKPGETVSLSNKAYWEGYSTTGGDDVIIEDYSYSVGGTVEVASSPNVEITKNDKNDLNQLLAGATFKMVEGSVENEKFKEISGKNWVGSTDSTGKLTFGKAPDELMRFNTVYKITETKAPQGYLLDETPHFFIVAKKENNKYPTYPDTADGHKIEVYYSEVDAIYKIAIENRKGEIYVEKNFVNASGDLTSFIKGTYQFGVFDNANGSGSPIQIAKIVIAEGQTTVARATFTNLELGRTYYVFELDDSEKPMKANSISSANGLPFKVTYNVNEVHSNSATDGNTVIVTNQACVSLPKTGGKGVKSYTTLGMLLLIGGAVFIMFRNKKQGKEKNRS